MQPAPPTQPAPSLYAPPSPVYGPPPQHPRPSMAENLAIFLGIVIGTLISVSLISFHAILLIAPACTGFGCPTLTAAASLALSLAWVFVITMDLAVGLSVCLAFIVGGAKSELPEATKRGMYTFAVVFLAVWIVFGTSAISGVLSVLYRF